MMLSEDQKKNGVIAASAGNHALALAYHGGKLSKYYKFFPWNLFHEIFCENEFTKFFVKMISRKIE